MPEMLRRLRPRAGGSRPPPSRARLSPFFCRFLAVRFSFSLFLFGVAVVRLAVFLFLFVLRLNPLALVPWWCGWVGGWVPPARGRSDAGWFAGLGVVLAVLGSRVGGLHVSVVYSPSSVVVAFLYISVPDEFYLFFCL